MVSSKTFVACLVGVVAWLACTLGGAQCADLCPLSNFRCGATVYLGELWMRVDTHNTSDCSHAPLQVSWFRLDSCIDDGTGKMFYWYNDRVSGVEVKKCPLPGGCNNCTGSTPPSILPYGTCVNRKVFYAPSRPSNPNGWSISRSRLDNRVDLDNGCVIGSVRNTVPARPFRQYRCEEGNLRSVDCYDRPCSDCVESESALLGCCNLDGDGQRDSFEYTWWEASCEPFAFVDSYRPSSPSPTPSPPEESGCGGMTPPWGLLAVFIPTAVAVVFLQRGFIGDD